MSQTCIQEIQLKQFRCFTQAQFSLDAPFVVIEGPNGSGKTSLLEALHYLCYVRSFRTHTPSDLIHFSKQAFFIEATLSNDQISIGSSGARRQIKINQKAITSYEELRTLCRIVTITQEDLTIVQASPEKRRYFLDHALALYDPTFTTLVKRFKHSLESRNAFLVRGSNNQQEYELWTQALWQHSCDIQKARTSYLLQLVEQVKTLVVALEETRTIQFSYARKNIEEDQTFEQFYTASTALFERERHFRRSLFGAHLDDIEIFFNDKPARIYSSRGQQKLITLLLKCAQILSLKLLGVPLLLLIDDFLSDLDFEILKKMLSLCSSLGVQTIITTPLSSGPELIALKELDLPVLKISI